MSYPVQPFRVGDTVRRAAWYAATLGPEYASETGTVVGVGKMSDANCATVDVRWNGDADPFVFVSTHRVNYIDRA